MRLKQGEGKGSGLTVEPYCRAAMDNDINSFHDEILSCFLEESTGLLDELSSLGQSLKHVGVPDAGESRILGDFSQKLNRLIGGTASMGFEQFTSLSRKTSLLAERCAHTQQMPVRILISNMNAVVALLAESFSNVHLLKMVEKKVSEIELRIDICMSAVGLDHPDIQSQEQIDELFASCREEEGDSPGDGSRGAQGTSTGVSFHDEILTYFIEETACLVQELAAIGDSLQEGGAPAEGRKKQLNDFAQKINRLVGGTATMGFEGYAPLSRKTSLLAAACTVTENVPLPVLVKQMNGVVRLLSLSFSDLDSIKAVESKIPELEKRIDICLEAIGIERPAILDQEHIDELLGNYRS